MCEEELRLLGEYQRLKAEYSGAVGALWAKHMTETEFERRSAIAEQARLASLEARNRLKRHIEVHQCSTTPAAA